jgi:hypothetical protein
MNKNEPAARRVIYCYSKVTEPAGFTIEPNALYTKNIEHVGLFFKCLEQKKTLINGITDMIFQA